MACSSWKSLARHVTLALALALVFTLTVSAPAAAQDADADGIAGLVDQCPGTEGLEVVNAAGCSVCPCNAAWPSHQAYVDCVTVAASRLVLTRKQRSAVLSHAQLSTCGNPALIRCCTWSWRAAYGSMGSCTVMAPAKCNNAVQRKFAEIRGTGSCYLNPCTW